MERPNATTVNVSLDPLGEQITFTAGKFVCVAFGWPSGWQRHRFTVPTGSTRPIPYRISSFIVAIVGDSIGYEIGARNGVGCCR